jgi:hypothetical protein
MKNIECVVSFDTTGSMYPCITQVRRDVKSFANTLFDDIPGFKMGVIAHGDYCDKGSSYVYKQQDITPSRLAVTDFISNCGNTGGGDSPECYELVLHKARSLKWTAEKYKALILIGDDVPHGPHENQNYLHLDWRNELKCLLEMGVKVYGVQALNRGHATSFYNEVAKITGGFRLTLSQFSEMPDIIKAICYQQAGDEQLKTFEQRVKDSGRMNRNMQFNFSTLYGRTIEEAVRDSDKIYGKKSKLSTFDGRFQVLEVLFDCSIQDFVNENGLAFSPGRGFYEFTKSVEVQPYKEVIVQDKLSGDIFQGNEARRLAGIPVGGGNVQCYPSREFKTRYRAFIQSTSYNRKLLGGTKFLYEISDYER